MTKAAVPARRGRRIGTVAGLMLLLPYLGYFAYSLSTGKDRMTAVCNQIKPGMAVDQVVKLAEEFDLAPRKLSVETKLADLAEIRSMGRHACKVELEAGVVKASTYHYAD
jgi:hypothetical protein